MRTNIIIGMFLLGLTAFGTYVTYSCPHVSNKTQLGTLSSFNSENAIVIIKNNTIIPDVVTIKKGGNITWINNDETTHLVESNKYPNSDEYFTQALAAGESFTYSFKEIGEWGYNAHSNTKIVGKVMVVE